MRVMGIESSCDETAVAIYDEEQGLLSHALHTQIAMHARYGGVVPELASRDHIKRLAPLLERALAEAGTDPRTLDAVAYTAGPGLIGALLTGAMFARTYAFALGVRAIAIHHLEGHLLAPLLGEHKPEFPLLALLISGGHTMLIRVERPGSYAIMGQSVDDAAGEAFDKTAKLLGLPYPGGPKLDLLAREGDAGRFKFPRPMLKSPGFDFSFAGLKTAALLCVREHEADLQAVAADIAASFTAAVTDTLVQKTARALRDCGYRNLVVAGGVSANSFIRAGLAALGEKMGVQVSFPDLKFCTDNAAMIAVAGALRAHGHEAVGPQVAVHPRWPLSDLPPIK